MCARAAQQNRESLGDCGYVEAGTLRPFLWVLLGMVLGCGEESPTPGAGGSTVVDSAGVSLVSNPRPRFATHAPVRFSRRPITRVGDGDDPGTQFGFVTDAARLTDGRVVVLDGQARDVRVFNESGTLERSWGGGGEGPGEFLLPTAVTRLAGDTVAVVDRRTFRVTSFGPDGVVHTTAQQQLGFAPSGMPSESCCIPIEALSPSRALWRYPTVWSIDGPGDRISNGELVVASADEAVSLGVFESGIAAPWPDGVNPVVEKHFSTRLTAAVVGSHVYVGNGSFLGYEVIALSSGELIQRVSSDWDLQPVTDELFDAWSDERRGGRSPELTPRRIESILAIPRAPTLPAYDGLIVALDGSVWLREPVGLRFAGIESGYHVFAPDGEWLGRVVSPGGLRILEVGEDYVLGLSRGDFDEMYVEVWGLQYRAEAVP